MPNFLSQVEAANASGSKIAGKLYHGRFGSKKLRDDVAILWSHDLQTAEDYAGKNGSVWELTDENGLVDSNIVIEKVQEYLEKLDYLPEWFSEIDCDYSALDLIDPEDIVDSAGWWDRTDFVEWFCIHFENIHGIKTSNGAVTLSPEIGKPKEVKATETQAFLSRVEASEGKAFLNAKGFLTKIEKYSVTSGDFKDDPEDSSDFKDVSDAITFMKNSGLVPKGTGKPTKPSRASKHDVAWDKDLDTFYLIVYGSNQGSVWLIDDEKGKAYFVSSFTGKFKPEQGVKIFKDGRYQDYMSLKGIQTILDIVNPEWSKESSDLN